MNADFLLQPMSLVAIEDQVLGPVNAGLLSAVAGAVLRRALARAAIGSPWRACPRQSESARAAE